MSITPEAKAVLDYLEPRLPAYLAKLGQLCGIESPSDSKSGIDEAGAWVQRWAVQRSWDIEVWPDAVAGNSLMATLRGNGQLRVMLVAHLDTVYPANTVATQPIRRDGDKLLGPGTADNKGGLLSGLYALDVLQGLNLQNNFDTLSMVCGGDEETDMRSSETFLRHLAPNYDLALILEPGRPNGDIVSSRKGIANYLLEATGKAAHAGVEPQHGAHAIFSLAQQIVALQALNGTREGLTVNVGVIEGGTRPNVVPDAARAEVDVRVVKAEDMEIVQQQIAAIAANSFVPDVTTALSGGWHFGPMPLTPQVTALVNLAQNCATELGFEVHDVATGGGSYANPLSSTGIALLDGLGPVGGHLHSPDEYISIPSIVPRIALVALLMLRHAQGLASS